MSLRDVGTVKDTTTITLYHPATGADLLNADGTPMTVTIHGPYSARYKGILRDQQQKRVAEISRPGARATMTAAEIEALTDDLLRQCVETWEITLEGDEKLPFSREAVDDVFTEFPWLKDQVNAALGNVADFLEPPKRH